MRMILAATLAIAAFALAPSPLRAVGSDDSEPPKPTETTTQCEEGLVWDEKTKTCVKPEDTSLNDDQRFDAVRELAYTGRYEAAQLVLAAMTEGETSRVMTYQGFLLRQTGQIEEGIAAYERALALDPANILARSYYGQLLVQMDEIAMAEDQLTQIRAHGGQGSWAERSLASAIATGVTYTF
ncbi:tetratricopeptide repeat protein [Rhodobacter sp. SY28-1]|uniref:tetratricopeptide repeat protein n=1 Tax=Rhodobacter sp. SY28-1 TaxID=2562317 RepID=UPI001F0EC9B0|nr:tetratricopeptide repeat protein [Rhodobacter sp. SY28-1]